MKHATKQLITKTKAISGVPSLLRAAVLLILGCGFAIRPVRLESQTTVAGINPQTASESHSTPSNQSLATIPFELYFNEIYVRVRVNNSEPLWFVVDSGAGGWIVDRARATRLGLHLEQDTAQGTGAGSGTYDVSYVKDVNFSVADFSISVPLIGVIDMSAHKSQIGREVEGLVGFDFFEKFIVEIDYEEGHSAFRPEDLPLLGSGRKHPHHRGPGRQKSVFHG